MVNDQNGCVTAVLLTIEHLRRANKGTLTVGPGNFTFTNLAETNVKYTKILENRCQI